MMRVTKAASETEDAVAIPIADACFHLRDHHFGQLGLQNPMDAFPTLDICTQSHLTR
jgi:hypothetical protein